MAEPGSVEDSQFEGKLGERSGGPFTKFNKKVEQQLQEAAHPGVPRQPLPEHLEKALDQAVKKAN